MNSPRITGTSNSRECCLHFRFSCCLKKPGRACEKQNKEREEAKRGCYSMPSPSQLQPDSTAELRSINYNSEFAQNRKQGSLVFICLHQSTIDQPSKPHPGETYLQTLLAPHVRAKLQQLKGWRLKRITGVDH